MGLYVHNNIPDLCWLVLGYTVFAIVRIMQFMRGRTSIAVASADVVVELLETKCLPSLYYVCPVSSRYLKSLNYIVVSC